MTCWETVQAYAFRSVHDLASWLPASERALPTSDITLCEQITLIGSGMIWNIYFGTVALLAGFFLATGLALARAGGGALGRLASGFIFVFRGSPLFIQFFFGYFLFLSLKGQWSGFDALTSAWAGAAIVLFFNTAAYSAEIFHGALMAVPKGDMEAADAYGLTGWTRFRRITWPTLLRLAWPAYTNEAIFLFHATTLVFFSGFPAAERRGDALYYASYFADKTFNPFVPYPILAGYFVLLTLTVIGLFALAGRRLNRHLPGAAPRRPGFFGQILR